MTTSATAPARPAEVGALNSPLDRVRVLDPVLRSAFDRGLNRSTTFVRLVEYLQHSDLIVYLVQGTCPGRHVAGCLVSVTQQGRSRYIRINVVLVQRAETTVLKRSPLQLIAMIGHELQHAVEIADEPSVVDGPSLGRMHIRNRSHVNLDGSGYETDAALQAGDAVFRELKQHNTTRQR